MNELLPCPFCGGEASVFLDANTILGQIMYKVHCKNGCCSQNSLFFNKQECFDAWNTRTKEVSKNGR